MDTKKLNDAAKRFLEVKAKIAALDEEKAKIEQEILELIPKPEDKGSKSEKTERYKVEVQWKGDWKANFITLKEQLPSDVFQAITRIKYEIDVAPMKKFGGNPDYKTILDANIVFSPNKPYIQVHNL